MQSERHRFSLVELLVVIVVIVILLGLLLPGLGRVRRRARATQCLSQLKQVGAAAHMYTGDYDDWLPPISRNTVAGKVFFLDLLEPYVSYSEEIWLCPAGETDPDIIDPNTGVLIHYGVNNYDYDDLDGDGIDNHLSGLGKGSRRREVLYPSEVIYVTDADPDSSPENIGGAQSGTDYWPLTSLCENRHRRGYNALYLAGEARWKEDKPNHVEWGARSR